MSLFVPKHKVLKDEGYASVLEVSKQNLLSSHAVKRFFAKCSSLKCAILRVILNTLFTWRLKIEKPMKIVLDIDTMVLNKGVWENLRIGVLWNLCQSKERVPIPNKYYA